LHLPRRSRQTILPRLGFERARLLLWRFLLWVCPEWCGLLQLLGADKPADKTAVL